ncbi:YopX family protein [Bacillus sp. FSL M8-0168]|uniref:YopX family protein n=1 Tax=Bacillus sp. FSL M8-0168 TaxID=2921614 RepID=UPI0030FDC1B9
MITQKYRYVLKHVGNLKFESSGEIKFLFYTLDQIEKGRIWRELETLELEGWELISRDRYTGLSDKKERDIYERDISQRRSIRYTDCSRSQIESISDPEIGQIYYAEGIWLGMKQKDKGLIFLPGTIESKELEVIGNIYENPDLLEAAEK